jgi:hypothetical protein
MQPENCSRMFTDGYCRIQSVRNRNKYIRRLVLRVQHATTSNFAGTAAINKHHLANWLYGGEIVIFLQKPISSSTNTIPSINRNNQKLADYTCIQCSQLGQHYYQPGISRARHCERNLAKNIGRLVNSTEISPLTCTQFPLLQLSVYSSRQLSDDRL